MHARLMPNADASADDDSTRRDVELTSEPGADSTSAVRPSASMKDGNWDEPRAASGPQRVVGVPRPGQGAQLPPLPVPTAPLAAPPASVAPPPSVPPVGMPSVSALSPRPVPSLDPRPITSADLVDDVRPPSLLSSLAATRPTNTWLSVGMVLVGVGFVVGLLLGRTSSPGGRALPVPTAVAVKPTPASAPSSSSMTTASLAASAVDAPPVAQPAAVAEPAAAAPATAESLTGAAASSDTAKGAAPKAQLEPFNAKAAHINLGNAAARAMHCRETTAPVGTVATVVTFIPAGRVADVTVTTPAYAGTRTGKCIIAKLKSAQVPPYSGGPETLKKTITLK